MYLLHFGMLLYLEKTNITITSTMEQEKYWINMIIYIE